MLFTGRRLPKRPEDDPRARSSRAPGKSASSARTAGGRCSSALPARLAALGAAIGWWLFLIGMLAIVFTTIGFVFEYYRGEFAH